MEDYFPLKMKRKEFKGVSDDFSEFSLSSPARKIRRLDGELLSPIIEEEEESDPTVLGFEYQKIYDSSSAGGVKIEELPSEAENEERALVLFKPTIVHSPSSYSVDSRFLTGIKNQAPWSSRSSSWRLASDEEAEEDKYSNSSDASLAVVPWVPSWFPSAPAADNSSQFDTNADMMDAEGMEEMSMDVEDSMPTEQKFVDGANGVSINDGIHQWQQQHCLIPQPPHGATPTPIVWYR